MARSLLTVLLIFSSVISMAFGDEGLPKSSPEMALVYIIRANAPPAPQESHFSVGHDVRVATLPNGTYSYFYIAPGYYQFWYKWPIFSNGRTKEFEEPVEAGKTYFFELRTMIGNGLDNFHRSIIWKYKETEGLERIKNCCKYVKAMVPTVDTSLGHKIIRNNWLLARPEEVVNIKDRESGYLRRLLAGNTAIGFHLKHGYEFKIYFDENGSLTETSDTEKELTGKWTIENETNLCFKFNNTLRGGCGSIDSNADGSYSFTRDGDEKRRFERIAPGKKI